MSDMTLDQAAAMTAGATMWSSVGIADAGVASFSMADGPMGVTSGRVDERDVSLLSPCPTALGASWNVALAEEIGRVIGGDAVARDVDALLAPNINLARSPLAGRAFEYFSEDPLLAGTLGAAWITGLQSTGTGSIAKHLVCNDSETGRDYVDIRVDERTLREVYLLPFELAAAAGCAGMLAAYNKVNGDWCSEQRHVITDIVKQEWRFTGVVMSDWFGTHSTDGTITSGLDLEMPGPARFMGAKLAEAVAAGQVSEQRVRDAAARVATTARMVTGTKAAPPPDAAPEILERAAAEGFVLLRNAGELLPIAPTSVKRIAVIGPNALAPCFQGGTFAKIALSPDTPTPIEAIRARYGADCEILFEPGVDPQPRLPAMPASPARDIGDGCTTGMTLDYFETEDCSGTPRFSETRATNSLVWFVGVHEQGRFDQPGSVRASGRFRAEVAGTYLFYLGATGVARLSIDGREVLRGGRELLAKDVMGALKSGDADSVAVTLAAGQDVLVTVEFRHMPARVHGLWYGIRTPDSPAAMLARAVAAAEQADAVFLIVGETSDSSVESKDRADTRLAAEQLALIAAVGAANPRTVAIVNVGHAFDAAWGEQVAALVVAWYPGEGFAPALAAVLAGDREPGGRMPVSIAQAEADYCGYDLTPAEDGTLRYREATRVGYRGLIANGTAARHPLGSGFGYARFDWSDARVDGDAVSVLVRNRSDRAGADVVQVYRDAPECALVGFSKVILGGGEERRVTVAIEARMLRLWQNNGWAPMRGEIPLRVARHAEDAGMTVTLRR